jgi:hypothetical protein
MLRKQCTLDLTHMKYENHCLFLNHSEIWEKLV